MTIRDTVTLYDYDKWATELQLNAVSNLSDSQYTKDLGSSHGGIRGTLVHTLAAQRVWLTRWQGETSTNLIGVDELPTFASLNDRWGALRNELDAFVGSLTEEELQQPLAYKDLKGNPYSQPLVYQMQHLVNHSTYHRGQITTMLRQLGVVPPSTDLIVYYRQHSS